MRRLATSAVVFFVAASLQAACHYGFEADSFNLAVPSLKSGTKVFSPFFFELDCVVFSACLDTLSRAAIAERLNILSGLDAEFTPILETFGAATNGFSLVGARGFCVPNVPNPNPMFRRTLQRDYGVVTCPDFPVKGANCWFRSMMDGKMEDFSISIDGRGDNRFAYYDLICLRMAWQEPFPTANSRRMKFTCADGTKVDADFMADVRLADTLETSEYQLLRLPLRGGAVFYAFVPKGDLSIDDLRSKVSSAEIRNLLASMSSVTDPGVERGPTVVVLPRLDVDTTIDLLPILHAVGCPTRGLTGVAGDCAAREIAQRVRFQLFEQGEGEPACAEKPADRQFRTGDCRRKVLLKRPFLFFVVHEPTETIPLMGQYDGPGTAVEPVVKQNK